MINLNKLKGGEGREERSEGREGGREEGIWERKKGRVGTGKEGGRNVGKDVVKLESECIADGSVK